MKLFEFLRVFNKYNSLLITTTTQMLQNYFKTAMRSFARQKGYTAINIAGLTVGIVASLLILLWVQDEVKKDKFHQYDGQLFQVMRFMYLDDGEIITTASIPKPLAQKLEDDYPEVDHAVLLSWQQEMLFQLDDKFTREEGRYASPAFFEIMSYPLLTGDPKTVLEDPYSVVISESVAVKYFGENWQGNSDLIGTALKIDDGELFKITGVFKNIQANSSLQFDFVLPLEDFFKNNSWVEHWGNNGLRMIVKLKEGEIDRAGFDSRLLAEINSHDIGYDGRAFLQPYSQRYLYSNYEDGKLIGGRIDYVQIFMVVAIFILIIASINFMNLATARSTMRAKEIGVRKVLGAQRGALRSQFMIESILMTLVATVFSVTLVYLLLPAFNLLTDKQLTLGFTTANFWLITGGVTLFTGLLSGSYPALFLSSFKILNVLKGSLKHTRGATYFRKGLVVFQFSLSILLIIGTLTVYRQINYIMTKNVGLNKENVLFMDIEGAMEDHYETFKNELLAVPEVKYVSRSSQNPLSAGSDTFSVHWEGQDPESRILFNIINADFDWIETMGVKLIAGRGYSSDFPFDSASYIVNERTVEIMGMDDPVGQPITVWNRPGTIVGVVRNFHMSSMYQDMNALVMRYDPGSAWMNFIRIDGDVQSAIAGIKAVNNELNPGFPFDYEFIKDSYEADYKSELVIGTLANYFAAMAIFISSLGLLGLASFTVGQRTKEIGIRKVLGASVPGLVMLLSKDFTRLIIIAFVIAAPVAYYYTGQWLNKFVYRINANATVFVVAGVGAFLVALLTVGLKSAQAAVASPADSLKDE
jgi:putative ABC transport system permease protein